MNTIVRPIVKVRIRDEETKRPAAPEVKQPDEFDQPFDLIGSEYRVVMNCRSVRNVKTKELHDSQPTDKPQTTHPIKEVKS